MTKKGKRKITLKGVIGIVAGIAALVLCIGVITSFAGNDMKSVSKLGFEVGGISETTGEYVERKDTVYTEKLIECQGLTVTPDFDSTVQYQIFWYNEDEIYFGNTEVLKGKFVSSVPECARYCRIMVIPLNLDEDGKTIKDFKVKFYEVQKYVKDLTIEIAKEQEWVPIDYYEAAQDKTAPKGHTPSIKDGYSFYENYFYLASENFDNGMTPFADYSHAVVKLDCEDISEFSVTFNEKDISHTVNVVYFDSEGVIIAIYEYSGNPGECIRTLVPENAAFAVFDVYDVVRPVIINKYLPR